MLKGLYQYNNLNAMDKLTVDYLSRQPYDTEPRRDVVLEPKDEVMDYPTTKEDLQSYVDDNAVLADAIQRIDANVFDYDTLYNELQTEEAALSAVALSLVNPQAIYNTNDKLMKVREALAVLPKWYCK